MIDNRLAQKATTKVGGDAFHVLGGDVLWFGGQENWRVLEGSGRYDEIESSARRFEF